ncbi:MAG: type II toxin-antitoxin system RelE/ParE family toxin [Candidatus Marinimicrobia bacterium]|nr:type II toxin-antitoxin system RelE/ParE family toxin [Candidatus Neomarinimicrobiota bacterium]
MKVGFLDPAEQELTEAIDYYNTQSDGLGYLLAAEVQKSISRIIHYPEAWTLLSKRTRRCLVNRFPYAVIYQQQNELIIIIAIQNLHQHPDSWDSRVEK